MGEITPISTLDIALSLGYLLAKWISLGILVLYILMRRSTNRLSAPSRLSLIAVVGASVNTIINMFLISMSIFNHTVIWILNLVIGVLALILIIKVRYNALGGMNHDNLHIKSFAIVALLVLWVRLAFLLGEFTYPGDDPKFWALIARRIIEGSGLSGSWGIYAQEEWLAEKLQLFMIGSTAAVADVTIATGIPLYKTVALVTQVMVWMTALGVHFLVEIMTTNRWAGICGALIYGLFVAEPSLFWISWGGNAELACLPYLTLLVALIAAYFRGILSGRCIFLLTSVLLASSFITHPFPVIYYLAAFIGMTLAYAVWCKDGRKILRHLSIFAASVLTAVTISLPVLLPMRLEELNVQSYYEPSISPFWTPIFSPSQTASEAVGSFFSRVFTVYGAASLLVVPIGVLIVLRWRRLPVKKYVVALAGLCFWWLILFFLHENNPNGLWLVKFPLWYRIDSNRTFCATSIAVAAIEAILLANIMLTFSKNAVKRLISLLTSKLAIPAYLLILIAVAPTLHARWIEPYTMFGKDDADLFREISALNLDGNIFVMPNDAGQWIPAMLGNSVIIPMGVATNHNVMNTYYLRVYPTLCKDPCSPLVAEYFVENGVSYVCRGGKSGHLEIYPYRLTEDVAASSGLLKPFIKSGKAVLYEYIQPEIKKLSEHHLELGTIWSEGQYNVSYLNDTVNVAVNNSWAALLVDLTPPLGPGPVYMQLNWRTERNVFLHVEALLHNGTIVRLMEPVSAAQFFRWGNGTIGWVDEYVRMPQNVVQIRLVTGGLGTGEIDRKITFLNVVAHG